LVKSCS